MSLSKFIAVLVIGGLIVLLSRTVSLAQGSNAAPPVVEQTRAVPGEVLVKFKNGVANVAAQRSLQAVGLRTLEVSPHGGWLRVEVSPGAEADIINDLLHRGDIQYATYNDYAYATASPNDPDYYLQWHLHQTTNVDIQIEPAWAIFSQQAVVTMAVVDTGVDIYHPDLQANIVEGYNFIDPSALPIDDSNSGHGTHVAGIAAAIGNNGVGVAGVSWRTKIMPIKVLDSSNRGTLFNLAKGISYAVDHGARVVNLSSTVPNTRWPCTTTAIIGDALAYADRKGVLVVIAAGNDGQNAVNCPAAYEEAIAVGATMKDGKLEPKSNYGQGLDLVAPGEDIYSTLPDERYGYKTGTSMSGPQVTGLIALVWAFDPFLSHQDMRQLLAATATNLGNQGPDESFSVKQINAYQALKFLNQLQLQAPHPTFLMADNINTKPISSTLTIYNNNVTTITWKLTIPANATWLKVETTGSGELAPQSSQNLPLTIYKPSNYGMYTADLTIENVNLAYQKNGLQLRLNYSQKAQQIHLPLLKSQ